MNDGLALAEMMRSGARTPCAVMQAAIDRAAASRDLGAVRFVDAAHGMEAARALDASRDRPLPGARAPFFGLPFLIKDLGATAQGLPKVCGSRFLARQGDAGADSDLTKRFKAAGTPSLRRDHNS